MRVRLIYSKRNAACFVPHIALAQVFTRTALRAGLKLTQTQGYSPHAKLSFGPELPAGVVALAEPVDMYLSEVSDGIPDVMNKSIPEGFRILRAYIPAEQAPSLGKLCTHAQYLMRSINGLELLQHIKEFYSASIMKLEDYDGWLKFIVKAPAQNPIGSFVKYLKFKELIAGWHELNIVRASIGYFNAERGCIEI